MPAETRMLRLAMRSRRWALMIDSAAQAMVARPPYTSQSPPKKAEAPASAENSKVHRRRMV
ncbi:hypothetical protein D3C81_1961140 [compost metagenome]